MIKNYSDKLIIGEILECPICGKEFKVTQDTTAVAGGGYTCSWKCFLDHIKRKQSEHIVQKVYFEPDESENTNNITNVPIKSKRGRPRKEENQK